MSQKLERRSFLGRLSLGITALAAAPFRGFARAPLSESQEEHSVRSIHPLGFQWECSDPFLFCAHHEDDFPKGNLQCGPAVPVHDRNLGDDFIIKDGFRMYHGKTVPGFPGHPHRGFETITVVRKGMVDHADSLGAAGRYGDGDVQWMTAGKGVLHSEMFPLIKREERNPLELFQIWLNLPAKNKMVEPHFTMLWGDRIPKLQASDASGKTTQVEVIAGVLGEHKAPAPPPDSWAVDPSNHVSVWNIKMESGAEWTLPAATSGVRRTLYFYEGHRLDISGKTVPRYHRIEVDASAELKLHASVGEAGILVLQGRPIGEEVIKYGPFVMNTKEEIQQAFDDYNRTRFGGWPWPRYDQVHPRDRGRFARHADGREEVKS